MDDATKAVPVIWFPLMGTDGALSLTEAEQARWVKTCRENVRRYSEHVGVTGLVSLLELSTAHLTGLALAPGAGQYEQWRASGANELLTMVRRVLMSEEMPENTEVQ